MRKTVSKLCGRINPPQEPISPARDRRPDAINFYKVYADGADHLEACPNRF